VKVYLRRFRSPNSFGLALFRSDWQSYLLLVLRPRERRFLVRLPRHLFGLSWWPPRFWNAAALLAERDERHHQWQPRPQQRALRTNGRRKRRPARS
jgi:hypothetical protein